MIGKRRVGGVGAGRGDQFISVSATNRPPIFV